MILFLQVKVHMRHILHHLGWKHMWTLKVNMEKAYALAGTEKEVIKSDYTPDPKVFRQRIDDFFANIEKYKERLDSLINTKFQKLKSHACDLQTSMG